MPFQAHVHVPYLLLSLDDDWIVGRAGEGGIFSYLLASAHAVDFLLPLSHDREAKSS
jgi:hypothetical protein